MRRMLALVAHPVPAAIAAAATLHVLWLALLANSGGDMAAQDAWADFAREYPDSAYNLAWYGGLHPVSYSALSPYLMAALGVRTTMVLAGTASAGLLALLLVRSDRLRRPLVPALYGAFALTGNAVSGRATFGLGLMFGLASLAVIFAWPDGWRSGARNRTGRGVAAGVLSALAAASSPVAGLFLGIAAAAMWLTGRRAAAYTIGVPPVAIVLVSSWLFPFSGEQPMDTIQLILPCLAGVFVAALTPRSWRLLRIASGLYVVAVLLTWLVPSPIGSNIIRLGLLFGGVVLIAAAASRSPQQRRSALADLLGDGRSRTILILAIVTMSTWQIAFAANDAVHSRPTDSWTEQLEPLVHQLEARNADIGRVEVIPARSHREASALAPYVNLARGWSRQADAELNPIFYDDDMLTPTTYRAWLDRWAVRYVVLPTGPPDYAADAEAALVADGLPYLREVWADAFWRLYHVADPTPLAEPPAEVTSFDASEVVLNVSSPGTMLVRIPYSPWLSLVDAQGDVLEPPQSDPAGTSPVNANGCLSQHEEPTGAGQPEDEWTQLHAPAAGLYRIAAPYTLPRGTSCPTDLIE